MPNVVNRCERCRKQKIRCSGRLPCDACSKRNLTCHFNESHKRVVVTKGYALYHILVLSYYSTIIEVDHRPPVTSMSYKGRHRSGTVCLPRTIQA